MIARGKGQCITPDTTIELYEGLIWYLPRNKEHRFTTPYKTTMDVMPYHPDTDFGATDETHPMVNRTWVEEDGKERGKIDNTKGRHAIAELENVSLDD